MFDDVGEAVVVCWSLDVTDNAYSYWELRRHHVSEHHVDTCSFFGSVVDEDIFFCDTVFAYFYDFEFVTVEADTFISVFTEDERLAMYAFHLHIVSHVLACDIFMDAVREDHTVLEHFYHRHAVMVFSFHADIC